VADVDCLAVTRVVLLGAVVIALAGCGGSGTTLYTKDATSGCLQKAGLDPKPVTGTSDFVANSATGGAFHVAVAGNQVTVSFGETVADADNLDQAYRRFRAKNVGIDDVLRRQENAVMLWHEHPEDTQLGTITSCLKG
jgi:FlaG/FlaF family flagellin (archaellin)